MIDGGPLYDISKDDFDLPLELYKMTKKLDDAGYTEMGDMAWFAASYIKELEKELDKVGKRMYS